MSGLPAAYARPQHRISVAGPPYPALAREPGANPILRLAMPALMKAGGDQLRALTPLIDTGEIRPVVDRVLPFEETLQAMEHVEPGTAPCPCPE